jgi:hypothetical protein
VLPRKTPPQAGGRDRPSPENWRQGLMVVAVFFGFILIAMLAVHCATEYALLPENEEGWQEGAYQ